MASDGPSPRGGVADRARLTRLLEATRSRVFDLAQPLAPDMPLHPLQPPYLLTLHHRYGDVVRGSGYSSANEVIVTSGHHSTHLDAPGHGSLRGRVRGGFSAAAAARGGSGLQRGGIEEVAPIVTRGVLLDIPRMRRRPLRAAEPVTADDLTSAARLLGVTVGRGDAVLVRTGWLRHWSDPVVYAGQAGGVPGVDVSGAHWLADRGVQVVGADTMGFEVSTSGTRSAPVHAYLLVRKGICILEMANLDGLSEARVYEFLFIATPLRLVGATGSPVRPIAII